MAKQVWKWEPTARWIRAERHKITVADTKNAVLVVESPGETDYYFPIDDVRMDLLEPSEYVETSGYRGTKRFWNLRVNGDIVENAAWTYDSLEKRPDFSGYLALNWGAMDHWYEEAEEVFYHPRNPFHRVDYINSTRHVEVMVAGVKVADSTQPLMVFETGLPLRVYVPDADVDMEYLTPVDSQSHCPYKGDASYYDVIVNGESYANTAWYYPTPLPESPRLKGTIAFWPEKDKRIQILIDGEAI